MRKVSSSFGLSRQTWWVPALLCCGATALVIRFVWCKSKEVKQKQHGDEENEVVTDTVSEVLDSLNVDEQDWRNLAHTALGEPVQPQDRELQPIVERCFPCDVLDVLHALYKPGSAFWKFWQQQQSHHHISQGAWQKQSNATGLSKWTRECKYRMPLNKLTSMGASFADNTEFQTLHHASADSWTMCVTAVTANVPMGNLFKCVLNLTASNDGASGRAGCRLRVHGAVVFHKPQPLKEALVRRPAMKGMRNTYENMLQLLQEQLQLWQQENVASLPLPVCKSASGEAVLDADEDSFTESLKPDLERTPSTKVAASCDNQWLPEGLQALLAALVFFAILLAAEQATSGAPVPDHRQSNWLKMLGYEEDPASSAEIDNSSVVAALLPSLTQQ